MAISVLKDIIDQRWGTYLTYNNIAILYQKIGQLENAENTLKQMLELDAENYTAYKRLAICLFIPIFSGQRKKLEHRIMEEYDQSHI